MSKNGSNKESIFAIYLKDIYQDWQALLGFELSYISLEQRHANRNIDLIGIDVKRRIPVYMEIQLTKANRSYLERIKKMVMALQEGVIVWLALSFDEEILKDLTNWIDDNNFHYTDFYAVSINPLAIEVLEQLNRMYKLEVYENMGQLSEIKQLLNVEYKIENIHPLHAGRALTITPQFDMSRLEDVKRAMLAVLRERIPYYLNFHYDKKMNLNDYTLTVGAGLSGLLFRCSWNNAKSLAFVELYFEKQRINWYESFLQHKQSIQNKVHPDIQFDNRKIGIYFDPMDSLYETFEMIAEVFEKFILFFCPYTYGKKEISYEADHYIIKEVGELHHQQPIMIEDVYETEDSYRIKQEDMADCFLYC